MNCGVSRKCGLDPVLLWLWYRPGTTALIEPLAWELPYAMGVPPPKKKLELLLSSEGLLLKIASPNFPLSSIKASPSPLFCNVISGSPTLQGPYCSSSVISK